MTDNELLSWYQKAKRLAANAFRYNQEAKEEFPSYVVLRLLQKRKDSRILLRYILADFINERYGDRRTRSGRIERKHQLGSIDAVDPEILGQGETTESSVQRAEIGRILKDLLKPSHIDMLSEFAEGMTLKEIGRRRSMSEQRVFQIFDREIFPRLKKSDKLRAALRDNLA